MRGVIAASNASGSIGAGHRIDVDEDRLGAGVVDRRHRRDEGERHGDDLIARADAGRQKRQMQRARAGVHADSRWCRRSRWRTRLRSVSTSVAER